MGATKTCNCQIGASGVEGEGSRLEYIDNPQVTCDRETKKAFAQGHDARLSARLATEVAEEKISLEDAVLLIEKAGGSEALVSKMTRSSELRAAKKATKKAKPVAEESAPTVVDPEPVQDDESELVSVD